MIQLHHLHGSPVPTPDLRGQVLPEDRYSSPSGVRICVGAGVTYGGGSGVATTPVPAAQISPPEFQYIDFSTTIG